MNEEIKIKRDIPMPERRRAGGQLPRYPFPSMEVGDMFEVEVDEHDDENYTYTKDRVAKAGRTYARRHCPGAKYSVRSIVGKVGIWRVA